MFNNQELEDNPEDFTRLHHKKGKEKYDKTVKYLRGLVEMSTLFSRISQKGKKAIFEERFANVFPKLKKDRVLRVYYVRNPEDK